MRTIVLLLALTAAAFAQASKPIISSDLGGRELGFLQKANEHSIVMQRLANLGKTKGQSEPVRVLGDLLGTTQSKEHDRLLALSITKGVTLSDPGLPRKMQDALAATDEKTFDRVWLDEIENLTKVAIQNFTAGAASADKDIKKFAEESLALAEQKLGAVKKVAGR